MKILGSLFWVLFALSSLIFSLLLLPVIWIFQLLRMPGPKEWVVFTFTHTWGRAMIWGTGSKITVSGLDKLPDGPVVIMGNHLGIFDIMLVMGYVKKPMAFIAKQELAKFPLVSTWMRLMGCLFLDRKDVRQAVQIIKNGVQQIQEGKSMVIFPEGTRSKTGELLPFRSGSMKLAVRAGVPIVPVSIQGTSVLFEKHRLIAPGRVVMNVGEPVFPNEFDGRSGELSNLVRERIIAGL